MRKNLKLEDAKVAIREKFKSIEDRIEINNVLNGLPTLDITEYADKHQAYSEGYAKGVVYGGLLKSEVSEEQLSKLKSSENSVENTTVSEDFTSISRAKSKLEVSEDCISREYLKSFEYINKGDFNSVETIREWIDNAPSVVPSRAEGEWVINEPEESGFGTIYECPYCKYEVEFEPTNYCPNCGAKMRGEER